MANIEAISLKPYMPWHGYYFVGPRTDGPALTIRVYHAGDTSTKLTQHIQSIGRYSRLPRNGEGYGDWMRTSGAVDMLYAPVERERRRRLVENGRPAVRHSLEIMPALSNSDDVLKAVRILGCQLLTSHENPSAPLTIHGDLIDEGIFNAARVITEMISNQVAQNMPLF